MLELKILLVIVLFGWIFYLFISSPDKKYMEMSMCKLQEVLHNRYYDLNNYKILVKNGRVEYKKNISKIEYEIKQIKKALKKKSL